MIHTDSWTTEQKIDLVDMVWNSSKRTLASQHEKVEPVASKDIQMSVSPDK